MKRFYMLMAVIGLAIPYAVFVPWIVEYGLDASRFGEQMLATPVALFFVVDVAISAVIVLIMAVRGLRAGDRRMWAPILGTLAVGASFGLPLYLYLESDGLRDTAT